MRIIYFKLKGYVGIYNGLGLNELEIDLSKSKHKIIVLSGINGCGKSTLLRALSIIPDGSSEFIPGVPAEKILRVLDDNNLYEIKLSSAAAKEGRGQSKASILKNGIELNPTGNIRSYQEVIYNEFDLDSNFVTLSRLSGDDRGLADKSPAERKKFMSFIVDSLETYNAIYKNLNKKSSIFKSYVNNLHTKIQNIGDEDNLRGLLITLENQRNSIKRSIDIAKQNITEVQTILTINDPNGTLQSQYETCEKRVLELRQSANTIWKEFSSICIEIGIDASIELLLKFIEQQTILLETHKKNIEDSDRKRLSIIERKESLSASANDIRRKITDLESGINPHLNKTVENYRIKVNEELRILNSIGVTDPDNTSKEELQYVFDTIKVIISMIEDRLYYDATEDLLSYTVNWNSSNYMKLQDKINMNENMIQETNIKLLEARKDADIIAILSNRPRNCKIDNCYFISTAYSLNNDKYKRQSVGKIIEELEKQLSDLMIEKESLSIEEESMRIVAEKKTILDQIRSTIDRNSGIFRKYNIGKVLIDTFEERIARMRSFDDFKDLDSIIDQINTITLYKKDSNILNNLESELKVQSNSERMVLQFKNELEVIETQLLRIGKELSSISNEIYKYNGIIETIQNKLALANRAKDRSDAWINEDMLLKEAQTMFDDVIKKSKESISMLQKISELSLQIQQYETQLPVLDEKISVANGQLMMLDQYKSEYNEYSEKYNIIETLKKYSSPTGGIQTLFMSLYMSKTLDLANKVLGMIFQGQYKLLDYVINSSEFRIPFVGLGLTVDDISSGSTSQVCMMGMVMNLVLLYQASTRYNITRLDEIDGGLDTRNRLEFVNVLYKVIDILEIDQLFIISHSLELELSNVDLILLKTYDEFDYSTGVNILYDFQNQH